MISFKKFWKKASEDETSGFTKENIQAREKAAMEGRLSEMGEELASLISEEELEQLVENPLPKVNVEGEVIIEREVAAPVPAQEPEPERVQEAPQPVRAFVVFRVEGKRYAVPAENVITVGELPGSAWMTGVVDTEMGRFELRDFKTALRLEGEAGGVYLIVREGERAYAWAVDGVERFRGVTASKVKPMPTFGHYRRNPLIEGLLEGGFGNASLPVYVLSLKHFMDRGARKLHPRLARRRGVRRAG